jgi:hypothetical protein
MESRALSLLQMKARRMVCTISFFYKSAIVCKQDWTMRTRNKTLLLHKFQWDWRLPVPDCLGHLKKQRYPCPTARPFAGYTPEILDQTLAKAVCMVLRELHFYHPEFLTVDLVGWAQAGSATTK